MQTLSATLLAAQKPRIRKALAKIVLTSGATTKTYQETGANPILDIKRSAAPWNQTAQVVLDNSDGVLTDLDLKGYKGVISFGATTSAGAEYSAKPPLWVIGYQLLSWATGKSGRLTCSLSLAGIPNLLGEDKANVIYAPDDTDTKTVKTLIRQIAGDTGETILTCYNHTTLYNVVFDSEDALIDVFQPKDGFRISVGSNRRDKLKELLSYTNCVARFENDGKIHIFVPVISTSTAWVANTAYVVGDTVIPTVANEVEYKCTTAGTSGASQPTWPTEVGETVSDGTVTWTVSYDYDYRLASTYHTFFNKSYRKRLVIPNYQVVESHPSHGDGFTGFAEDTESSDLMEIRATPLQLRLASNAQATSIATARIAHYKLDAERGSGFSPMNVGAEEYDFVKIKDSREVDYRVGNVGYINEHYTPGRFEFDFRFGSIEMGGGAGTLIPMLSESLSTGARPGALTLEMLMPLFEQIWSILEDIITYLETVDIANPFAGYIWVDASGDIHVRPKSGQVTHSYEDINPKTTNDANLGSTTKEYLAGYIKKAYHDTRLQIPVGTDMYD